MNDYTQPDSEWKIWMFWPGSMVSFFTEKFQGILTQLRLRKWIKLSPKRCVNIIAFCNRQISILVSLYTFFWTFLPKICRPQNSAALGYSPISPCLNPALAIGDKENLAKLRYGFIKSLLPQQSFKFPNNASATIVDYSNGNFKLEQILDPIL